MPRSEANLLITSPTPQHYTTGIGSESVVWGECVSVTVWLYSLQAFESEIKSNKDQLEKLINDGERIKGEKPDLASIVDPRLDELRRQWKELEDTTADKGERLFDANRHVLYEQSVDDIDGWIKDIESQIVTEDVGHDLTTVNLLVQKQNVLEVS